MVIDTSAVFGAIANEPDGGIYREAIKTARVRLMSADVGCNVAGDADCPAIPARLR
jgi:uncharacterized protein with PIN domain